MKSRLPYIPQFRRIVQEVPLSSNLVVSNVPGSPVPQYMAGAKIAHIYPVGPLIMGMGINFTVSATTAT